MKLPSLNTQILIGCLLGLAGGGWLSGQGSAPIVGEVLYGAKMVGNLFLDLLRIRASSALFRLDDADEVKRRQEQLRAEYRRTEAARAMLPYAELARKALEAEPHRPVEPLHPGRMVFPDFDVADAEPYIDWSFFFAAWGLKGRYPEILDHPEKGAEARKVFADGQAMLKKIIEGRWLQANGVLGLFPANRVGDDIEFYTDASRTEVLMTWYGLRQQTEKQAVDGPDGRPVMRPSRCLADFVAPKDSGVADYAGLFAVTAGIGAEKKEKEFLAALDDYSSIMFKALADRLAEAFAECLHERVRKDLWGYAADEHLSNEQLIKEQYQGIRPAPGYPACPDHTAKIDLFKTLDANEIGMQLTESLGNAAQGLPFTVIVDKTGVISRVKVGMLSETDLDTTLGRLTRP